MRHLLRHLLRHLEWRDAGAEEATGRLKVSPWFQAALSPNKPGIQAKTRGGESFYNPKGLADPFATHLPKLCRKKSAQKRADARVGGVPACQRVLACAGVCWRAGVCRRGARGSDEEATGKREADLP